MLDFPEVNRAEASHSRGQLHGFVAARRHMRTCYRSSRSAGSTLAPVTEPNEYALAGYMTLTGLAQVSRSEW